KDGLDKKYAFQYSNGIVEPFTLLLPNILGGASANYLVQNQESATYKALAKNPQQANQLARYTSAYWGEQPITAPYYGGVIVVLLFALGVVFADKKYVWWLVSITILGIMLSWGKNFSGFNNFMFDYFPGYNKFRSVTFAMIFPILAMNLLGFIGLEKLLETGLNKQTQKKALIALGSVMGIAIFFFLTGGFGSFKSPIDEQLPVWLVSALKQDRVSLLRADAGRALLFIMASSAIIFMVLKSKLSQNIAWSLITILILIDMWGVDNRVFGENNYGRNPKKDFFVANDADIEIKKDNTHYRVFNLINPWNDARTSYHHHSLGGYHGAKMGRYQDLIETHLAPEMQQLIDSLRAQSFNFNDLEVVNMLNTKYFIAGAEKNAIIPNYNANGAAWLVNDIKNVASANEEIQALNGINTKTTAIVNTTNFNIQTNTYNRNGNINLEEYTPNYLRYKASISGLSFAVFSEIYYPKGWSATIDGTPIDIIQTNYVLRGLEIPAGEHVIEFRFAPKTYAIGNPIMLVSSLLILLAFGGSIFMSLKE
ncbi:MAG: YfhO family protein, partial [Cyclobacteriaceae bacterium]|nr:YfhO family protein [Cyclobacteriaceae bacterium]